MTDASLGCWVCPWGICNHQQAQACRAEMKPSKGCGGRFPGLTAAQAKEEISRPPGRVNQAPRIEAIKVAGR